jgi:cation diffusion facilitator CzcD-associated flavoprotein CzcO
MTVHTLETDYLVVGSGAAGMAFTDSLIEHSDSQVIMLGRRHRPGGHWNDAYPFVRLHQPSAFYGVNSLSLGRDRIDTSGPNAGCYEVATAAEICAYFDEVMQRRLLPSGRVRFFPMCDYVSSDPKRHRFVSRLNGDTYDVIVRRKLVDATYLETSVPATHVPAFEIGPGVPFGRINDLVRALRPSMPL